MRRFCRAGTPTAGLPGRTRSVPPAMKGRSLSIIELGEIRDEPEAPPPVRPPRAAGRPLRSAAVLLLTLVTLAAAAPVWPRVVTAVPSEPDASAYLTEDGVVVIDAPTPSGDRYLTVYDQPGPAGGDTVRRRWRAALERSGDYVTAWTQRGMLLAVGVSAGIYRIFINIKDTNKDC